MSNTKTERVPYGFKLNFPKKFTMRELRRLRNNKVSYITLYMRVKNAIKSGELTVAGLKTPTHARRGRKELVFTRSDAKVATLSAAV
jgi:hypothetical protein